MDSLGTNLNSMISVQPPKGSLTTMDKPTSVQVFFHAKKEVKIEHQPILRCHVREFKGKTHSVAGLWYLCQKEEYVI